MPGLHAAALVAVLAFAGAAVVAQSVLPRQAVQQFERVIGNRVEAVTILGFDYGAAGGLYTFRGGDVASVSLSKIGRGGKVADPRPLGGSGLEWTPMPQGNLGHILASNEFRTGYLMGNESTCAASHSHDERMRPGAGRLSCGQKG